MTRIPVIAVLDVGKTNKKILLFNEQYEVVFEESCNMEEISDEDGFPCDDVQALTTWVNETVASLLQKTQFAVKAINFSAYGASFVYLDAAGNVLLPLYNYLKPYPKPLMDEFYTRYGGEEKMARETASPVLGSLNSGMQVYRLKKERPEIFAKVKTALHLPQYLSYILCRETVSDITSIGCHTGLWDFSGKTYHEWVRKEGLDTVFPAIRDARETAGITSAGIPAGTGLHDSSAALIPYLSSFTEPFVLLSTGTWCITLNPFNHLPLTKEELRQDCLCYLSYTGHAVKAARLFAGYEHEQQVKRLAAHFAKAPDYYKSVKADPALLQLYLPDMQALRAAAADFKPGESVFGSRELAEFATYEEAYHRLIADIIALQVQSSECVIRNTAVKKIFVDGGFSKNGIYMHYLAMAFPECEVNAATVAQASALGAAMALHEHWTTKPLPVNLVQLKKYSN